MLGHSLACQCKQWRLPHENAFGEFGGLDRAAFRTRPLIADGAPCPGSKAGRDIWRFVLPFGRYSTGHPSPISGRQRGQRRHRTALRQDGTGLTDKAV